MKSPKILSPDALVRIRAKKLPYVVDGSKGRVLLDFYGEGPGTVDLAVEIVVGPRSEYAGNITVDLSTGAFRGKASRHL